MVGGFSRVVSCFVMWALGAAALGGSAAALVVSAVASLALNHAWRETQRKRALVRYREEVAADERLRLTVRELRERPPERDAHSKMP